MYLAIVFPVSSNKYNELSLAILKELDEIKTNTFPINDCRKIKVNTSKFCLRLSVMRTFLF